MDCQTVAFMTISLSSGQEITCSAWEVCVEEHGIHYFYCVQWKMYMFLKHNQFSTLSPAAVRALSLFFCYCSCSAGIFGRGTGTLRYLIHSVSSLYPSGVNILHFYILSCLQVYIWITDFFSVFSSAVNNTWGFTSMQSQKTKSKK